MVERPEIRARASRGAPRRALNRPREEAADERPVDEVRGEGLRGEGGPDQEMQDIPERLGGGVVARLRRTEEEREVDALSEPRPASPA